MLGLMLGFMFLCLSLHRASCFCAGARTTDAHAVLGRTFLCWSLLNYYYCCYYYDDYYDIACKYRAERTERSVPKEIGHRNGGRKLSVA